MSRSTPDQLSADLSVADSIHDVALPSKGDLGVQGLSVSAVGSRGRRTLVNDVAFTVAVGESVAIVGESGSGKSLTSRALVSLLPSGLVANGSASFGGEQLLGRSERELRRIRGSQIALLMQDPFTMLNPMQSVRRHIVESLPRSVRKAGQDDEVTRRLAEVGIDDNRVADRYPFQLSGGMQQRVAIACALAKSPQLLIADEPTTALDATIQQDVLDLLGRIQRERRMSLILITHDLRVAFSICDRALVMYAGSMVESGATREIETAPRHPYSLGLLLAAPAATHVRPHLVGLPGNVPTPDSVRQQCSFADRCSWAADECRDGRPPLALSGYNHYSACVRAPEIHAELRERLQIADRAVEPVLVAPGEGQPLLRVTGLEKSFASAAMFGREASASVLHSVNFDVFSGESVGLVGESGSGKTTIARCVLGLERPTGGSIMLAGHDLTTFRDLSRQDRHEVRQVVQCVFQDPFSSLNPAHSLRTMLREALRLRSGAVDVDPEVARLLKIVRLPADYAMKRPASLSGGERQRAAIARAIASQPRLLICDEAVAALDVLVQAQILELIRELRRELNISLLFISHDLAVIRQVTERTIVLDQGRIVEHGPTNHVLDNPQHPYTQRLVAAATGQPAASR